jgi:hypothetical protein
MSSTAQEARAILSVGGEQVFLRGVDGERLGWI